MKMKLPCLLLALFPLIAIGEIKSIANEDIEKAQSEGKTVMSVAPIYSQLFVFPYPLGFVPASETQKGNFYMQSWLLKGETVGNWSQRILVSGLKDTWALPNYTVDSMIEATNKNWQTNCPATNSFISLGKVNLEGVDGAVGFFSCGTTPGHGNATPSIGMLMVFIRGEKDFYSIQWFERDAPYSVAKIFLEQKWIDRYKKLLPFKLCPLIPGEVMPYPSCVIKR